MKEYATLTELMAGRESGSVKAISALKWERGLFGDWFRPGRANLESDGLWYGMSSKGRETIALDSEGPWLLVSEDPPAPTSNVAADTLRLTIAAHLLGALYATHNSHVHGDWVNRHAYALAEADALIAAGVRNAD